MSATLRFVCPRCGLRDVPTLILNITLAWANIVLYYEMPHWVKNFDCISINEWDPDDIKVFKVRLNLLFMDVSMYAILSSMTCSVSTMA